MSSGASPSTVRCQPETRVSQAGSRSGVQYQVARKVSSGCPITGARAARSGVTVDLRVQPDAASLQAETVPAMAAFIAAWTRTTRTPQRA